ncbi:MULTISPECIES: DUF2797 domain-containing protein [unclassified Streptomyces]|uniref:DUF2797 domain-containing protein n=1 Tax=unclassified Streptomyces TaxID=2593676 RepID=UPI002DD9F820|nr:MULTISPECIES: DUF2797 domain-containing protein [unclassified Streptomyces]WSC49582.1 DUF2797 domain-containing protein [Streptomyces sp. NBC_01762]WSD29156.1 DUF2797 domain-containing protein [Streptomyces sp. NBC_01751]
MDQALPASGTYVCHGITWASGDPRLLLAPVTGATLVYAPVTGRRLGYQVSDTSRWCTGRYRFADRVRVEAVACPDRAPAEAGGQCAACAGRDDFRFAHRFHSGGHVPDALAAYMAQPHWLYLATFADGTTKIGTAAEPRKRSRLDEQGAVIATYLAQSPDGRAVRFLEDALTRRLNLTQTVRAAAKLTALAELRDLAPARAAHQQNLDRAAEALSGLNVPATPEPWTPPGEGELLRTPGTGRVLYAHDPRSGEHGLTVLSCLGSQVLASLDGDGEQLPYLLDLGALKGRRIVLGAQFSSPPAAVQSALF